MLVELDRKTLEYLMANGMISKDQMEQMLRPGEKYSPSETIEAFYNQVLNEVVDVTAGNYRKSVEKFYDYLERTNNPNANSLHFTEDDVKGWIDSMVAENYSMSSIRRVKYGLNRWAKFVEKKYGIKMPNIAGVKIEVSEIDDINAIHNDDIYGMARKAETTRAKSLILFIYETGMRRSELINTKKEHVDFDTGVVDIINERRSTSFRRAVISEETISSLQEYLDELEREIEDVNAERRERAFQRGSAYNPVQPSEYLFRTLRTPQIGYSTILRDIKGAAYNYYVHKFSSEGRPKHEVYEEAQRLADRMDAETLRNSRRIYLFAIGRSIDQVQAYMGDENQWTCKRFLSVAQVMYPQNFGG